MPFTNAEKHGVIDLLQNEEQNVPILIQLGKSVTKNVIDIATTQEALEYIFMHTADCVVLLNKRAVTKEVLFKYLHSKKVAVNADFTKAVLVKTVIEFWNKSAALPKQSHHEGTHYNETTHNGATTAGPQTTSSLSDQQLPFTSLAEESEFPIHLLARKFAEWFFNNYNQNSLKPHDFWQDARLLLRITADDGCDEHKCDDSESALETLYEVQQRFGFFFNPNLNHAGAQGRMDVHGLVLVLSCGSLHTQTDCVGVFECTFGLLRDPFSENNWKTKTIQLTLRSKGTARLPSLEESDTLKEALALPVTQGDLA